MEIVLVPSMNSGSVIFVENPTAEKPLDAI
jgi:hypothetical protein